jgi:hypothetical protein
VLLFKEKDGNKKGGSARQRATKPLFKYFCFVFFREQDARTNTIFQNKI